MKFMSFVRRFGEQWLQSSSSRGRRPRAARRVARHAGIGRLPLELLEDRTLMSVLPAPTVIDRINLSSLGGSTSTSSNESTPSVAIDPLNPQKMVAVYTRFDSTLPRQQVVVEGVYSNDGGQSWLALPMPIPRDFGNLIDPNSTVAAPAPFPQNTDANVAFDRQGNVYILYAAHTADNSAGALVLQKYNFSGTAPTGPTLADGTAVNGGRAAFKVIHQWVGDPVISPTLVVDNTAPNYTDPQSNAMLTNRFAGNVYVAWATNNRPPTNPPPTFNPNTIQLVVSRDRGATFSSPVTINDGGNFGLDRNTSPKLVVSQGTPDGRILPGQITVVWDDFASGNISNPPVDIIRLDNVSPGVNAFASVLHSVLNPMTGVPTGPLNRTITDATDPGGGAAHTPALTTSTVTVTPDESFTTVSDVDVTVTLVHPAVNELRVRLIPPAGSGITTPITLFNNQTNAAGNSTMAIGITGANLGTTGNGIPFAGFYTDAQGMRVNVGGPGTTFSQQASRSIIDRAFAAPYTGIFRPEGSLGVLSDLTRAQITGTWTLEVTDFRNSGADVRQFIVGWSLSFTSGLIPSADRTVAATVVRGALTPTGTPLKPTVSPGVGIGPNIAVAVDNTLGSFSPNQGRIYVAYVAHTPVGTPDVNPADNTDIFLISSADNGQNWTIPQRVNDDSALQDGFSEDFVGIGPSAGGRPQFQPTIAVDQYTGTVVISYRDARHDAARARTATYVATSIDGGQTFGPQIFVNESLTVTDAITGLPVDLGPIPDNQSGGNPNAENTFSFGDHQGLAVANGRALVVWSGNRNGGFLGTDRLDIYAAPLRLPAGPRIVSSTMGPVADPTNPRRASDGTRLADTFELEFDRPIDPATFTIADVTVTFRTTTMPSSQPGIALDIVSVTPLGANALGATRFQVRFDPTRANTQAGTFVGTYSYTVGPNIRDRIRLPAGVGNRPAEGALMDQNADGQFDLITDSDKYAVPRPLSGIPGQAPYDPETLPLIVPGPSVVSTQVPGSPLTTDNLVLDQTVSAIDVVFDRDMDPLSFGPEDIARLMGPAGLIGPRRVFPSFDVNRPIPDRAGQSTPVPLVSTLTITDSFKIADLEVQLNITHPRDSDLIVVLIAPNGTRVQLFSKVGGQGQDFVNTEFDDQAPVPINAGTPPFAQVFRPAQSLGALRGLNSQGTWRLEITDDTVQRTGVLNSWSLIITPEFTITPNPAGTPLALAKRTFRIGFPTQELSGTYVLNLGTDIRSSTGERLDTNRNAGLAVLRGTVDPSGATSSVTFTSTQVPVTIVDNDTVISTISVTDEFVIAGLTLTLDITHSFDPDLEATLIDPRGTRIKLFTNVGDSGTRQNFTNTTFDDAASTPIQNGGPPFFGRFNPQMPLSALRNRPAKGIYTLEIRDSRTGNTGRLNSWSLTFQKPTPGTGLGELVADQASTSFRIFTMNPANPLARNTWTAVGPASINGAESGVNGEASGRIGGLAVDPSDPSGNTVFVAGASGGVWKSTNFLTTAPTGPTYVPLTDFGPSFGMNIGGLAVFGRNNDPNQSVVFAATGEGDTATTGVGFLRSMDGGATWTLLDSTTNVDANGNLLPISSLQRDHVFFGTTAFKVVVDPRPTLNGEVIVYAALSGDNPNVAGNQGGIWRSEDTGKTWSQLRAGQATDVVLDLNSASVLTGNLQIVYSAFTAEPQPNQNVYFSSNRGQTWSPMLGGVGDPLIQSTNNVPTVPVPVTGPSDTPNGTKGRIVLARPELTGDPLQDIQYQGWLYALVITGGGPGQQGGGLLNGLYLTKDFGQNWTRVRIPSVPGVGNAAPLAVPSNDSSRADYDPFGNPSFNQGTGQGAYDVSLVIDPNNPNVVYIGGTLDGPPSGLIRVDTTGISDPYAFYLDQDNADGGQRFSFASEPVALTTPADYLSPFNPFPPSLNPVLQPHINMIRNPDNPFLTSATFYVNNTARFSNTGADVKWIPFDDAVKPNPRDPLSLPTTDQHRAVAVRDPLTGHTRLIFGDDQGVFTAVDRGDGTFVRGLGGVTDLGDPLESANVQLASGSRNGNLQITQFYYGAAQPSNVAAQAAAVRGLFYGQAQDDGFPLSDPNLLINGNLNWTGPLGDGTGVATDQTGSGTLYQYNWPCCGGNTTDFFQVNTIGRTFGLVQQSGTGQVPDPQWPFLSPGYGPGHAFGQFAVNPVNGDQMIIGSSVGRIFSTDNQGRFWNVIGEPASLDSSPATALAFGAPRPGNVGNLNDFMYIGTLNGSIFVTFTGGGSSTGNPWTRISTGLDGSPVMAIVTNPTRGSREAYAVTRRGVYHMVDASAANPTWVRINDDNDPNRKDGLFEQEINVFGDPRLSDTQLKDGRLTALQVDWRYAIPDDPSQPPTTADPALTHPVLYVGGEGGVYRSLDDGRTWRRFPDVALDGAPQDGGLLPNAQVTDLDLSLGNINPTTGRPNVSMGPDLLVATTYGRGTFAIRVAPLVFGVQFAAGSDSGFSSTDRITNVLQPVLEGFSQQSAFGNRVRIQLFDRTDPNNPRLIGTGQTNEIGKFSVQINAGVYTSDGSTDGVKVLGIQAVDDANVLGPMATFTFTLDTTPFIRADSVQLDPLQPPPSGSDSGRSPTDRITNVIRPVLTGIIDQSAPVTVRILDITNPNSPQLIATGTSDASGRFAVQVNAGVYQANGSTDGNKILQVQASNVTRFSNTPTLAFTLDTLAPGAPTTPDLLASSDTGASNTDRITNVTRPTFQGSGEAGAQVQLFANGILAGTDIVNSRGFYTVTVTDPLRDGIYDMTARQVDVAGNAGPISGVMSPKLQIIGGVVGPTVGRPTIFLSGRSDTGVPGDNITAAIPQIYDITAEPLTNVVIKDNGVVVDSFTMGNITSASRFLSLPVGTHTLRVEATDIAGNTRISDPLTVIVNLEELDPDRKFVRAIYLQALGRPGSLEEWNMWVPLLTQPDGRSQIANGIERSGEGRTRLVKGWYETYLGRTALNGEEQFWVARLVAGQTEEVVLGTIFSSTEFYLRAPQVAGVGGGPATDTTLIKAFYSVLLNRQPGAGELDFWLTTMAGIGRAATATAIMQSTEHRTLVVQSYYANILGRRTPATPGEVSFWVNSGFDFTTVRVAFEGSVEFFFRATGFNP